MSARQEIDETDVRIIKTLLKNSRTSFAKIANECNISTNTIRRRYVKLKKSGVITGLTINLRLGSLGYKGLTFLAIEAVVNKEQSVLKFLDKLPNIFFSHIQLGKHNIVSIVFLKKLKDLTDIIGSLSSNPHIVTVDTAISMNQSQLYNVNNLIIEPFNGASYTNETFPDEDKHQFLNSSTETKPERKKTNIITKAIENKQVSPLLKLDKIDLEIIKLLKQNSRMSFRKLAKKLGITTKTVIQRYKILRKEVIASSTVTLNLRKLGYVCNAIFCIMVSSKHNISNTVKEICQLPNVISVTRCVGGIDVLAIAPLKKFEQLFKLRQKMVKIPDIERLEILLEKTYSSWP